MGFVLPTPVMYNDMILYINYRHVGSRHIDNHDFFTEGLDRQTDVQTWSILQEVQTDERTVQYQYCSVHFSFWHTDLTDRVEVRVQLECFILPWRFYPIFYILKYSIINTLRKILVF